MQHTCPILLAAFLAAGAHAQPDPEPAKLLRFPHIQGDKIVFVHGGDIWTASARGGAARRLTSYDEGFEIFPRISPDGRWVAFSGEYSGTRQVWVVPYAGGEPKQLTFYPDVGPMPPRGGYDNLVFDWTPDGSKILVRMNRTPFGQRVGKYFLVDRSGEGLEQPLQLPEGGPASLSPDGRKLAYNIISREWRTWKRYSAGRAQDVWIYDLDANSIRQITDWRGTDNWPMWLGDKVYFASDRAHGILNLFAYDTTDGSTTQVTDFRDYDVLFPSRGDTGVIFEHGGELWVMDAGTERVRKLSITLADDRPWTRAVWKEPGRSLGGYSPSPSAKRAVVGFRGDLFSVPAKNGEGRNLTQTPDRREMQPSWSPDGKSVAFLAEDGDDYELFTRDLASGEETKLTDDTGAWILGFSWLPDSKAILFTDKRNRLVRVDVDGGGVTELDRCREGGIRSVDVSRDGGFVCYVKPSPNGYDSVWISPSDRSDPVRVTTDDYDDSSPVFDPSGELLYFTSARDYVHRGFQFEERIYALLLRDDVANPTAPLSDEEAAGEEAGEKGESGEGKGADAPLSIQFEGLAERLVVLDTGGAGSYGSLTAVEKGVLFTRDGKLELYEKDSREVKTVLSEGGGHVFTPDRKNVLYRQGGGLRFAKVSPGAKGTSVPLADVRVKVVPQIEWSQMYRDAWRVMRDWFYDPNMHGVDWVAMRDKHAALLPHVSHRSDLDFLLGELVGELNSGHTYVLPGETPHVDRAPVGTLGCELEAHDGRYRIARIYPGENWNESTRSPLREPGIDVKVGDYLLAIDGNELTAADNPYRYLDGKVGKQVELRVDRAPDGSSAREVAVRPAASDGPLRYIGWVERNRRIVSELSNDRIGYIHVPNTSIAGHRELFEGWRAQARVKEAMIIDDRYNGGGFIPSDMTFEIGKPVLSYWSRRHDELSTTPTYAFEGPRLMLINGYSSSGGDAFPYYFRELGLGKLMGRRTWGGLIGYSGSPRLVDGGGLAVPSFAFVNPDGEWDVEGIGVSPDIEVFDDPTLIQAGREPMLEQAVKHLLRELDRNPKRARPKTPPAPIRDRVLDPGAVTRPPGAPGRRRGGREGR